MTTLPIARLALIASVRHPSITRISVGASGSNFFKGRRSTPGIIPATSQLDRLSSTTQISVES
jgi:hypothetical protein